MAIGEKEEGDVVGLCCAVGLRAQEEVVEGGGGLVGEDCGEKGDDERCDERIRWVKGKQDGLSGAVSDEAAFEHNGRRAWRGTGGGERGGIGEREQRRVCSVIR